MATPANSDLTGQKVGEYEIIARLGVGGMGVVYEGLQPLIGKRVAVKVLLPGLSHEPEVVKRFLAEARAVNAIGHRGIVDIFSFGALEDGSQYFVMEYLDGVPFNELVHQSAPLPVHEVLRLLDQILDALDAAHCAGIVHRDIKPSNIFLVDSGRQDTYVKILDFGIAKLDLMSGVDTPQTHPSIIVGTPDYIAPEQARGQAVGPATDLYALGCVAFELLTGKRPFKGDNPIQTMFMHVEAQPPAPSSLVPNLPPEIDEFIAQLLKKKPSERPATAAAVRARVSELRATGDLSKPVVAAGERPTQVGRAPTSRSALSSPPRTPSAPGARSRVSSGKGFAPVDRPATPALKNPRSPAPLPPQSGQETRIERASGLMRAPESAAAASPSSILPLDTGSELSARPATPRPPSKRHLAPIEAQEAKPAGARPPAQAAAELEDLRPDAVRRSRLPLLGAALVLLLGAGTALWIVAPKPNPPDVPSVPVDPPKPVEPIATPKPIEPVATPEPPVVTPEPVEPVPTQRPPVVTPKPPQFKSPTTATLLARIDRLEKRLAVKEDAAGRADKVLRQFLAKARTSAQAAATPDERREVWSFLDDLDRQITQAR